MKAPGGQMESEFRIPPALSVSERKSASISSAAPGTWCGAVVPRDDGRRDGGRRAGILEMQKKAAIRDFVSSSIAGLPTAVLENESAAVSRGRRVRGAVRRLVPDISRRTEPSQRQPERVCWEHGRGFSRSLSGNRPGVIRIPAKFGVLFQSAPRLSVEAQSFSSGLI